MQSFNSNIIMSFKICNFCFFLLLSSPIYAYIGPGLGAGTIAAVAGMIFSIVIAIFAIVYYPVKRFLKKNKGKDDG